MGSVDSTLSGACTSSGEMEQNMEDGASCRAARLRSSPSAMAASRVGVDLPAGTVEASMAGR
jgi:hypothetical protein